MGANSLQKSGDLAGLVLAVLDDGPSHGYAIAREIERRSADALSFGEGALYPALRSLEKDGFVVAAWDTNVERGPARKVYHITPEGILELSRVRNAWSTYSHSVSLVLGGKTAIQPA